MDKRGQVGCAQKKFAIAKICALLLTIAVFLTTKQSFASDLEQIQAAIDSLPNGGVVELKDKTYHIDKAIVLHNGITLKGAGRDKTIIRLADNARPPDGDPSRMQKESANHYLIRQKNYDAAGEPQGNRNITVKDLTLDGNAENNMDQYGGIWFSMVLNYRIENIRVRNCRRIGILTGAPHTHEQRKSYILDCIVEDTKPANLMEGGRAAPYGHGIYTTAIDNRNVIIKGNTCRGNYGAGIHCEDDVSEQFVLENECYDNKGAGIWFCEAKNSVIRKNKIYNNGVGVSLSQGRGNANNLICENDIYGNAYAGIQVSRQYQPGESHAVIINNRIWNNDRTAIEISDSAAANVIAFNLCYDDRNLQKNDSIVVNSDGNRVINNFLMGNNSVKLSGKDNVLVAGKSKAEEWKSELAVLPMDMLVGSYGIRTDDGGRRGLEKENKKMLKVDGFSGELIQKQLDALGPEGGTVLLPKGIYDIERPLLLRGNTTLKGVGRDETVIRLKDNANPTDGDPALGQEKFVNRVMVRLYDYSDPRGVVRNITVRDLTLDGNAQQNEEQLGGIWFSYALNYHIENIRVTNCRRIGILIGAPHTTDSRQGCIRNCIVENTRPARSANRISDAPYGHGIYLTAFDHLNALVKDNVCRNNAGSGIHLEDRVRHIWVENNQCYDNRQHGIWAALADDCVIKHNEIYRNLSGVSCGYSKGNLIYGNHIYENRLEGVYLGNRGFDEYIFDRSKTPPSNCLVVGNVIHNNNQAFMDAGAGIFNDTASNIFAFNLIYDDQSEKTQFMAIYSSTENNVVMNNWFGPAAYFTSGSAFVGRGKNRVSPWDGVNPWSVEDALRYVVDFKTLK